MRLIDANALKVHICNSCDGGERECKGDESSALLVWVNDMPTIEAEPVRHGRWIKTKLKGYYECSECRCAHSTNPNQRFCSYCGARMDGGADNANN